MTTEIELKFLVSADAQRLLEEQVLKTLDGTITHSQHNLYNDYYDTVDGLLREHDCGLRVRGSDGQFEQTLKTAGQSVGGLQQRPEFNVDLPNEQLDVALFATDNWPEGLDLDGLQERLVSQFVTHFSRDAYFVTLASGTEIEIVFDQGNVEANGQQSPICEIELELISGDTDCLFSVARKLISLIPGRLGYLSKAARGYHLINNTVMQANAELEFVPVTATDTLSQSLLRSLESVIKQWQYHEQCYQQTNSQSAILAIAREVNLLHHLLRQYAQWFSCEWLTDMAQKSQQLLHQWQWLDDFFVIKTLASKRGLFHKTLAKYPEFSAYIAGRKTGLLSEQHITSMFHSEAKNLLQLALVEGLVNQPWFKADPDAALKSVKNCAVTCLNEHWSPVFGFFGNGETLQLTSAIQQYTPLRQAYFAGVLFAECFVASERAEFRSPWVDILSGIEELHVLQGLLAQVECAEIESAYPLISWVDEKNQRLLSVLEQTRTVAIKKTAYW